MNRLCYITRNYRGLDRAGNKAKTDNEDTLVLMGATNLGLKRTFYSNKVVTFFLDLAGVIKYVFTIRRNDIVVLQYPIKKYFRFLCNIAKVRNARTITVIHDLGSFRRKKLTIDKEIARLMHTDYVIASNDTMCQWLKKQGYGHPMGALGLFDYRSASRTSQKMPSTQIRLVYAGALAKRKNAFLLELAKQELAFEFHIYGNRKGLLDMKDNPHIVFHPFMPADKFIEEVEGDFGLVWDGDSLDSCTGNFGEYLRWNSPHKVSFYIRAGLPVIIWREAAVAPIIQQEGIGLLVDSIKDLDTLLPTITQDQMQQMRQSVKRISEKLNNGQFLWQAVRQAENELKEQQVK